MSEELRHLVGMLVICKANRWPQKRNEMQGSCQAAMVAIVGYSIDAMYGGDVQPDFLASARMVRAAKQVLTE